jgi:hypothetical protein
LSHGRIGKCKLTGAVAPFVRSHILPKALTKPSTKGSPLFESTQGTGPKRKWSSWYNENLVCRKGEDFLSSIDDRAIKELRKHKLIWSGWDEGGEPKAENIYGEHSIREIGNIDQSIVWLFFASVAWRASASKLDEMNYFKLPATDEDSLKCSILNSSPAYENYLL